MSRTISPPPIGRRVGLAIMTLCFAVIAGGLGVARTRPSRTADERAEASKSTPQPNAGQARRIEGVVLRPDGKPANGATVVAGIMDATHNHTACTTGTDGRFTFPVRDGAASVYLAVHKAGLAPATRTILPERDQPVEFKLDTPAPFSATLVDSAGRPVGKRGCVSRCGPTRAVPEKASAAARPSRPVSCTFAARSSTAARSKPSWKP